MEFREKYIKYKIKYLKMKELLGGAHKGEAHEDETRNECAHSNSTNEGEIKILTWNILDQGLESNTVPRTMDELNKNKLKEFSISEKNFDEIFKLLKPNELTIKKRENFPINLYDLLYDIYSKVHGGIINGGDKKQTRRQWIDELLIPTPLNFKYYFYNTDFINLLNYSGENTKQEMLSKIYEDIIKINSETRNWNIRSNKIKTFLLENHYHIICLQEYGSSYESTLTQDLINAGYVCLFFLNKKDNYLTSNKDKFDIDKCDGPVIFYKKDKFNVKGLTDTIVRNKIRIIDTQLVATDKLDRDDNNNYMINNENIKSIDLDKSITNNTIYPLINHRSCGFVKLVTNDGQKELLILNVHLQSGSNELNDSGIKKDSNGIYVKTKEIEVLKEVIEEHTKPTSSHNIILCGDMNLNNEKTSLLNNIGLSIITPSPDKKVTTWNATEQKYIDYILSNISDIKVSFPLCNTTDKELPTYVVPSDHLPLQAIVTI
jgi:exonuclease III